MLRTRGQEARGVKELIRTNDPVLISFLTHRLREEGIEPFEMDMHMSLMEGSLGILPKRIMVADDDYGGAQKILDEVKGSEIG
jgi:RNA:NAD 2'-phosphotransferase (TPT1/KptA family)